MVRNVNAHSVRLEPDGLLTGVYQGFEPKGCIRGKPGVYQGYVFASDDRSSGSRVQAIIHEFSAPRCEMANVTPPLVWREWDNACWQLRMDDLIAEARALREEVLQLDICTERETLLNGVTSPLSDLYKRKLLHRCRWRLDREEQSCFAGNVDLTDGLVDLT